MRHMMQENLGIYTCRQIIGSSWQHVFIANTITDDCYVSNRTRERGYIFPLHLYPDTTKEDLFSRSEQLQTKWPNLNEKFLEKLNEVYKKKPMPEEIFYYIYAVLYSNTYREKYREFLKTDFPRVPFTADEKLFRKLGALGGELVSLHLMKSDRLDSPAAKYPVEGQHKVDKVKYDAKKKRVYINTKQYFDGVAKEVWEYQVGGYRVCESWLKYRKGSLLSGDEQRHYCRIVTALGETLKVQKKIDGLYNEAENKTVGFE